MKIETNYLEKKIKKKLVNKKFKKWNKDSIKFLVSIFEYPKYDKLYDFNLNLLDDYINWYKKNTYITDQYPLDKLIDLYCLINCNLYKNININYIDFLEKNNNNIPNNSIFDIYFYALIAFLLIMIKYLFSFEFNQKKEEKKHIFELQIPIPDNILNNPLIKYFLGNIII
jgi:hypothetical protein